MKWEKKILTALILVPFWVGCSSNLSPLPGNDSPSYTDTQGIDNEPDIVPEVKNQAPTISCNLKNMNNGEVRSINTIAGTDTFYEEQPRENENLQLDCTNTSDNESKTSELKFFLSLDYAAQPPVFTEVSTISRLSLTSDLGVGRHYLALKTVDADGNESIKDFRLTVRCSNPMKPKLDYTGVTATPGDKLNFFTYSIDPSKVKNVRNEPFAVAWDFNGDGAFDPKDLKAGNSIWGQIGEYVFPDVYTIFATENIKTRKVGIKILNSCQEEGFFEVALKFPMPNIPRNPTSLATIKPYYYLQADINGPIKDDTFLHQRVNGEYLATWYPSDKIRHVSCDYKVANGKGTFAITGRHNYKKLNDTMHGMTIKIENIPDQKAQTEVISRNSDGIFMSSATYKTSSVDDAITDETYSKIKDCDIRIAVTHATAVRPCTSGPAAESDTVTILGEFQCPLLTSGNNQVSADNGKFFCEVATVDKCVGGGGGGGGGVPPPEQ